MSLLFGEWNFGGRLFRVDRLRRVSEALASYASDRETSYESPEIRIFYRAFSTTKESRAESQPFTSRSGAVITWDGRLDNRDDFGDLMDHSRLETTPDVRIVAAAYERWNTSAFRKLMGDWAISVWSPEQRVLVLAKDPVGTRQLYYVLSEHSVQWSTILDPLVALADSALALDTEYLAGCFSFFPAPQLTPFAGIQSVPPACFVRIANGRQTVSRYWDFDAERRVHYNSDAEYERHFREVFAKAVGRCLRSDAPVLAELSGGMDSSAIVCVADQILAKDPTLASELETVSYYDETEANWDDQRYFSNIEQRRGRAGLHIETASRRYFRSWIESRSFAATPYVLARQSSEVNGKLRDHMSSRGIRVLLSGTGGDEVTGGVPTFLPEIEDLLAQAQLGRLAQQLKSWALATRRPWLHLLFESVRGFLPLTFAGAPRHLRPADWLRKNFVARNKAALSGYASRVKLFGAPPSFQENVSVLDGLRRQMACRCLSAQLHSEKRYPYLDRDLLEFLCAIPREQLLRPGERRSLMRRALGGIVPDEILNRRRKAFVVRSPLLAIAADWPLLTEMMDDMMVVSLGMVDRAPFKRVLLEARAGRQVPMVSIMRTLLVEAWLRSLARHSVPVRLASPASASAWAESARRIKASEPISAS